MNNSLDTDKKVSKRWRTAAISMMILIGFFVLLLIVSINNVPSSTSDKTEDTSSEKIVNTDPTLSSEEQAEINKKKIEEFIFSCGKLDYKAISRKPDDYMDKKVKFSGKILQVMDGLLHTKIRVATKDGYDDIVLVQYSSDVIDFRLLEGDKIAVYGSFAGIESYTTILKAKVSIPKIKAVKIKLIE